MTPKERIYNSFLTQAKWCDELGSRFTAALLRQIANDFENNGIFYELCGNWPDNPISDALGLRICGGLHFLALNGQNPDLCAQWPPKKENWDIDAAFKEAKASVSGNFEWFCGFIKLPPQTNEVRRSAAIFAGLCYASSNFDGLIDILELGASAGLNQSLDEFEYMLGGFHGCAKSNVKIDTEWRGISPNQLRDIKIRNRAACDQSPIDVKNADSALLLQSYIWPDQIERHQRVLAAIEIAKQNNIKVDKQDAGIWIGEKLENRANDAMTIVFHSVFFNYPHYEIRKKIHDNIYTEILTSKPKAPLVWLRFENYGSLFENTNSNEFTNHFVLDIVYKDFATGEIKHEILAKLDPHCRWIEWL